MRAKMFALRLSWHCTATAAYVKTVNEVWPMLRNCQPPIVALLSEWGVKMEMEEEEKKNMQALSDHCHAT